MALFLAGECFKGFLCKPQQRIREDHGPADFICCGSLRRGNQLQMNFFLVALSIGSCCFSFSSSSSLSDHALLILQGGVTALHEASNAGQTGSLHFLLAMGGDVTAVDKVTLAF